MKYDFLVKFKVIETTSVMAGSPMRIYLGSEGYIG
jgi:hypothetical protein